MFYLPFIQLYKVLSNHSQHSPPVHDPPSKDNQFWGDGESDVEAELRQVICNYSPNLRIIGDVYQLVSIYLKPLRYGSACHHALETAAAPVMLAYSFEALKLLRGTLHSKLSASLHYVSCLWVCEALDSPFMRDQSDPYTSPYGDIGKGVFYQMLSDFELSEGEGIGVVLDPNSVTGERLLDSLEELHSSPLLLLATLNCAVEGT